MKIALICFTQNGVEICQTIGDLLVTQGYECKCYAAGSVAKGKPPAFDIVEESLSQWTGAAFSSQQALIFVSAVGIAVRAVASHLKGKTKDPAVVVVDEKGTYAISLLSGHIGGANELTRLVASGIGATPVITTATDINDRFAVDEWAREQNFCIADIRAAKAVSAALLRREPVGFYSEFPIEGALPEGLYLWEETDWGKESGPGVIVSFTRPIVVDEEGGTHQTLPQKLWLTPRILILGVGCRRGTKKEQIASAVEEAFHEVGFQVGAVKKIVSIDLKQDEEGLIEYAKQCGIPFEVFSKEELAGVKGDFTGSTFVQGVTGVDNVCERAAVLGSGMKPGMQGTLLLKKKAKHGVTIAVAVENNGRCLFK